MNNIISLNDHIITHCHESMERALSAERYPSWQRSCPEMNDIDFTRFGLLRCISAVDSGRHFLQTTEEVHGELLPHSTYFKSLNPSSDCGDNISILNNRIGVFNAVLWHYRFDFVLKTG